MQPYKLLLSEKLYKKLQKLAKTKGVSMADVLRMLIDGAE